MKLRFNKTDTCYWTRKVSFHSEDSRTYSVHIQHDNQRRRIGLKTTDKEQAGALALEFVIESDSPPPPFDAPYGVIAHEWDACAPCWLRARGVVENTAAHAAQGIRQLINALTAARRQRTVRHGGIGVTARHYVENRSDRSWASATF